MRCPSSIIPIIYDSAILKFLNNIYFCIRYWSTRGWLIRRWIKGRWELHIFIISDGLAIFLFIYLSTNKCWNAKFCFLLFFPLCDFKSCCCTLGQELLQLLISEVGSDVVFIVNGDKIKAHKWVLNMEVRQCYFHFLVKTFSIFFARAILCARSNYFSAMLYGDWIEGKTKEIPLIGWVTTSNEIWHLPAPLTPPPPPAQHKFFLLNKTPAINSGSAIHGQDPILKGSKFMTKTGSGEFLDEALWITQAAIMRIVTHGF